MLLTEDRLHDLARAHARDERLRIHLHLQAVRDARPASGPSRPLRRRLGATLVRLGQRVAGEPLGSAAPAS